MIVQTLIHHSIPLLSRLGTEAGGQCRTLRLECFDLSRKVRRILAGLGRFLGL